jgi:hypothetical protein
MQTELNTSKETRSPNPQAKCDSSFQRTLNFIKSQTSGPTDMRKSVIDGSQAMAQHFCSPYLILKLDLEGRPFEHAIHFGDIPAETWQQLCSVPMLECISTQKPQASFFAERSTGTRMAVLTLPVSSAEKGPIGVASVVIQTSDATAAKQHLTEFENLLQALINVTFNGAIATPAAPIINNKPEPAKAKEASRSSSTFLEAFCNGRYWDDPTPLAYHLVNGLRNELQCLDVSFGILEKNQVRLLAISGHDSIYRRSPGCITIEQAMTEVSDCGHAILVQTDSTNGPATTKLNCGLHHAWRASSSNCSCLSIPIKDEDDVLAICSLRRDESQPFTTAELAYIDQFQARIAERVKVACNLNRTLWSHLSVHTDKTLERYFGSPVRKMITVSLIAAVAFFLFIPWPHSLNVPCKLVSANPRVYSAPFAGKVKKVHFRNGDMVTAGSVLFEMDTDELSSRRAKLEAEVNARTQAMIRFLQEDETAKAGEEKSNLEAIRNELSMVETKLSQAVIRAEESGTIFDSDLFKREGETVALGEQLLNFAPTSSQQVELQIPDYLGMEVKVGQQGQFVTAAEPDRWYTISVERVETASTSENGENVIKAIGKGTDFGIDAKLGMSGFAQVSVGKQAGWWILLQKPVRYIQRKVWQL